MTTDFYTSGISLPLNEAAIKPDKQYRSGIYKQLVRAYLQILYLGTPYVKEKKQLKYIKISNFVAMMALIASVVYMALSIIMGNLLLLSVLSCLFPISIGTLYLNKIGKLDLSRVGFIIPVSILLYIAALIVGPYADSEYFLLIAVILPFLIYDIDHIKLTSICIILPLVLLLSYPYVEPFFAPYHLSPSYQHIISIVNIPMEVILCVAGLYLFAYYSRKTELELEASNQRLTVQADELTRSNADLEQFAYVISHDLKAPVRNISCFMNLLAAKHDIKLDQEATEFVQFALSSSKRLGRLIDDVLAYSRIGRNLSAPVPVDLNDLVNTIKYETVSKSEMPKAIIYIDRKLPVVHNVHSTLMYHVFQNLIRNGLKFNKSEYPEVNITWQESKDRYTFALADNGIGISQEYKKEVFQMFKRLHAENVYDGTGIGLAICKKIIESYKGNIWYESDGQSGTTFYFTIPKV
jgi:signal transduction histidine kinase